MSYLVKRQNPLSDLPTEEIEEAFAKIAHHFDDSWLRTESGTHLIQQLWNRRDALATNELFTFGKSLLAAEKASRDWLKGQIKLVRGKEENNQRGAIFEILSVGFSAPRQTVIPAPASQPGYDLDIVTTDGTQYRVSLKRYSQSSHEKLFLKKSAHAEKRFLDGLRRSRHNALCYVEAREYPSESDWQKLYSELNLQASRFNGKKKIIEIEGKWLVGMLPLVPEKNENLSTSHISHSFVCASPYHKNEHDNFSSKLETAVSNLERHVKTGPEKIPIIIMQLPVTASASTLAKWSNDYLSANKSSILDAVFFLQPYTASNEAMTSNHIAYYVSAAASESFHAKKKQALEFEVPVGIVTSQPPEWKLCSDIGERQLPDKYVYQQGKHYVAANREDTGNLFGQIKRKAPGIESIAVFNINGQSLVLGGRFGEELCLIGN